MPKIVTKKQRLETYIAGVVECNTPKKSDHCLKQCGHGKLHTKEIGRDACHTPEFCSLSLAGIRKVCCKSLSKKDQKKWVNRELDKC